MPHERTDLGPYRLRQRLGDGIAGDVYLAETDTGSMRGRSQLALPSLQHTQQVAIKLAHGDVYAPIARSMLDQASLVACEHHPHVAPLYEVGELDGLLYVTMPYRPASSLADRYRLARSSDRDSTRVSASVPAQVVADLIWDAAQALAAAHRLGVVHGDLKPQNIFITPDTAHRPVLQLADFGQSQYVEALAARQGWSSAEALLYAAPEQIAGETVAASDQYSLAGIAYLLVTGEPPHVVLPNAALNDARHAVLPDAPIPAHLRNPEAPRAVDDVLARALAREPLARYSSILEFADALNRALGGMHAPLAHSATPTLEAHEMHEQAATVRHAALTQAVAEGFMAGGKQIRRDASTTMPASDVSAAAAERYIPASDNARKARSLAAFWHFVSYVLVGVASTVVNLVCFQALYVYAGLPYTEHVRYLIGYLGSAEIATMFNFILNDRFTFAGYDGKQRPWLVRCLRFHSTVINGFILTFIVSGGLHYLVGVPALISQAAGIFVAFVFNYMLHHVWTYRARKRPVGS